jgi:hypothetical protein
MTARHMPLLPPTVPRNAKLGGYQVVYLEWLKSRNGIAPND